MKFGSVRFFKVIIVAFCIWGVVAPIALAVTFGVLYSRTAELEGRVDALNRVLDESGLSPEDLPFGASRNLQAPQAAPEIRASAGIASFDYQQLYPEMYVQRPQMVETAGKVCYLTFDDGPSPVTARILDTLAEYDAKATFFVTGENSLENVEILRAAANAGHTIGVHTWSHNYQEVYKSVEAYLEDFERMYSFVAEVTGTPPAIFRFAGGSVNTFNQYNYPEITAEMLRRGFVFYDWNAAASDAVVGGLTRQQVQNNVLASVAGQEKVLVLMHDRIDNSTTASALPTIIDSLQKQGFRFEPLTAMVEPVTFTYYAS